MNTKQIQYVMTIWECGSFSQASNKLFISQPSLSQYIINLEKELGVTLFDRRTSPLQLTDAGRIYVRYANQILDCYKQMERDIRDLSNTAPSHITIGAPPYFTMYFMAPIISEFKRKWTNISISLKELPNEQRQQAAIKGEIDLFFTTRPIDDARIEYRHILTEHILLALPPTHRLVSPEAPQYQEEVAIPALRLRDYREAALQFENDFPSISLSEMRDDSFVMPRSEGTLRQSVIKLCSQLGFEPKIVLETKSIDITCAMVLEGIGIAFVPETAIRFTNLEKHPIYYRIKENSLTRNLYTGYGKARHHLSWIRDEFINVSVSVLKSSGCKFDGK